MRQKNASLSILDDWQFELRVSLGGYMGVCEQEGIFLRLTLSFILRQEKNASHSFRVSWQVHPVINPGNGVYGVIPSKEYLDIFMV